jgi:hypothetical protein
VARTETWLQLGVELHKKSALAVACLHRLSPPYAMWSANLVAAAFALWALGARRPTAAPTSR